MTVAAFLTSSCDRPSVTTTSTLGTPLLMPLSQVKTFSLINVSALPAKCIMNESVILSAGEEIPYFMRQSDRHTTKTEKYKNLILQPLNIMIMRQFPRATYL